MTFFEFSKALDKLEQTSSRLEMTELLAQLYQQLDSEEIEAAIYLMQGRLVPQYQSLEFNLSSKMIQRALAKLLERHQDKIDNGTTVQANLFGEENNDQLSALVKKKVKQLGDLGLATEEILQDLEISIDQQLAIAQVFNHLRVLAKDEGQGSQERKILSLVKLLEQVKPLSARYITRVIMGKVRLGFSTMTLLDALSWAVKGNKSDREKLEEAFNKQADVGNLAKVYLTDQNSLTSYSVQNGVPVMPALAQRLNTSVEVVEKMGQVLAEPKYDGLRVQIHFRVGKSTKVFTRNLDDISHMFPELDQAEKVLKCQSCILDAEAIGYDPKTDQLLPFQQTITRRRKHGVADQAVLVPLRFYVFDILEFNDKSLVDQTLLTRKDKLNQVLKENRILKNTRYLMSDDPQELKNFHSQQLELGLEGAIFKKVESVYRGGRKGWRWVKMKEAEGERGKLNDTLDCIVMGYYLGKGKRSGFGIGAILVGIRDEKTEKIETLTKIGTGLTDEQFKEMKQRADSASASKKPAIYDVPKGLIPDVWIDPQIVIEVAADEITHSPTHSAGIALRFPRLVQFRDDKSWEEATTLAETKQIKIK